MSDTNTLSQINVNKLKMMQEILNIGKNRVLSSETIELAHILKKDHLFLIFDIDVSVSQNTEIIEVGNILKNLKTFNYNSSEYTNNLHKFLNIIDNDFDKISVLTLLNYGKNNKKIKEISISNSYGYVNVMDFYLAASKQKATDINNHVDIIINYDVLKHACKDGHIEIIKWCYLHYKGWFTITKGLFEILCDFQHIDILDWYYENIMNKNKKDNNYELEIQVASACYDNKLQLLNWLHTKLGSEYFLDKRFIDSTCIAGHSMILDWFYKNIPGCAITIDCINYASKFGQIKILDWYHKNKYYHYICSDEILETACINLKINVLEWFKDNYNVTPKITDKILMEIIKIHNYSDKNIKQFIQWANDNCKFVLTPMFKYNLIDFVLQYKCTITAQYLLDLKFEDNISPHTLSHFISFNKIIDNMWLFNCKSIITNEHCLGVLYAGAYDNPTILNWFDNNHGMIKLDNHVFCNLFSNYRLLYDFAEPFSSERNKYFISKLNILKKYISNFDQLIMENPTDFYLKRTSCEILDWFKNNTSWNCKPTDTFFMHNMPTNRSNPENLIHILNWFSTNSDTQIIFNEKLFNSFCEFGYSDIIIEWFDKNPKHIFKYDKNTLSKTLKAGDTYLINWLDKHNPALIDFDYNIFVHCIKNNYINVLEWFDKHLTKYPLNPITIFETCVELNDSSKNAISWCENNESMKWMLNTISTRRPVKCKCATAE